MSYLPAIFLGVLVLAAAPQEPWARGFYGVFEDEKQLDRLFADMKTADLHVSIDGDDKLDIGVGSIRNGGRQQIVFTLEELELFFKHQRHKDFIVVTYDKNAPQENLNDSLAKLKKYFQDAGYKRILFTHAHSSGVRVHEDFRPKQDVKAE